jgi:hypothetical protein
MGGGLLIAAGAYAACFDWWETRVPAGDSTRSDHHRRGRTHRWLAGGPDRARILAVAAVFALLLAGRLAAVWRARRPSTVDR